MHFGVILPNYGLDSNPDAIRRTVELAEELGFDSVWATEHIIVGPEAIPTVPAEQGRVSLIDGNLASEKHSSHIIGARDC